MKTAEKTAEGTIYRHKGFTVTRDEGGAYEVRNSGGEVVETFADARPAAIESCREWSEGSYPDRLWWAIQEVAEGDHEDVKVEVMEQVAALLGIDAETV